MNKFFGKRILGFTVVELMIVLVIVGLLLALAYPSYVQYVRKAKRGEAQQLLMNWSINQEIWRSNNTTYAANDAGTGIAAPTHDSYTFEITNRGATTYTLEARASGDQLKDKTKTGDIYCGDFANGNQLTINQNGVKSPALCWD
jgi:type IV pilus assembly protein PilE